MEQGPDTSSEMPKLSWQDIRLADIHIKISAGQLSEAQTLAKIRRDGLVEAVADIDDVLEKAEGEISESDWQQQKEHLAQEIQDLNGLIETIARETK